MNESYCDRQAIETWYLGIRGDNKAVFLSTNTLWYGMVPCHIVKEQDSWHSYVHKKTLNRYLPLP